MSLSQPTNPPTVNPGTAKPLYSGNIFGALVAQIQANQIKGISPNNAIGAGIPKQVSNVQVSVANAQTGSTCTVTLLFRRDSTDKSFSGVNVWVRGYQGNNQYVQVASASESPATFVLNNTGETVSFTIQTFGNGGNAPITQSPTSSAVLPKSTGGGFGSSTTNYYSVTNPPPTSGAVISFFGPSDLVSDTAYPNLGSSAVSTTLNQVTAFKFSLEGSITVGNAAFCDVTTVIAASHVVFGIYNSSGGKLFQASFLGSITGKQTVVCPSTQLAPGVYYLAVASDNTGVGVYGRQIARAKDVDNLNQTQVIVGQSPNLMVAGVLPASLGVLVADTIYPGIPNVVFFT